LAKSNKDKSKPKSKKKYSKPALKNHGTISALSDNIIGATNAG
jgi:hypothetical protein